MYIFSALSITHTFPCLISKKDTKPRVLVELEIQMEIEKLGLSLLGWYHSHPTNPAMPSLRDCDNQLEYQIKLRGPTEISYIPCIGVICCKCIILFVPQTLNYYSIFNISQIDKLQIFNKYSNKQF